MRYIGPKCWQRTFIHRRPQFCLSGLIDSRFMFGTVENSWVGWTGHKFSLNNCWQLKPGYTGFSNAFGCYDCNQQNFSLGRLLDENKRTINCGGIEEGNILNSKAYKKPPLQERTRLIVNILHYHPPPFLLFFSIFSSSSTLLILLVALLICFLVFCPFFFYVFSFPSFVFFFVSPSSILSFISFSLRCFFSPSSPPYSSFSLSFCFVFFSLSFSPLLFFSSLLLPLSLL